MDWYALRGLRVIDGGEPEERSAQLARVLSAVPEPLQEAVLVRVPSFAAIEDKQKTVASHVQYRYRITLHRIATKRIISCQKTSTTKKKKTEI